MLRFTKYLFSFYIIIGMCYGAAIMPLSQQVLQQENITNALTGELRRAPANGMDLETFTKNAAIRTNQENAILQQLAFRRNSMLTTRDLSNVNNTLASQVADSDLMNALLHPSSAGHSAHQFGFQGVGQLPAWEKDRLLVELMEQNRRQQLEIQRLVQQNMIRQGRPVMPFLEEDSSQLRPQFAGQIQTNMMDFNNKQLPNGLNLPGQPGQGRIINPRDNSDNLAILNSIRSVTSRAANGLDQIAPSGPLTANDLEFIRRQTNPFEAPQRIPQSQSGFFREEVTDAFGRRLPVVLKDFTTMNGVSAISGEAYVSSSSTTSTTLKPPVLEMESRRVTPPVPAPPTMENFNSKESTKKTA